MNTVIGPTAATFLALSLKDMLYDYPANYVSVLQFICFVEVTRKKNFRYACYISARSFHGG
jgi:hypothetical protein